MKKQELLNRLKNEVQPEEWELLQTKDSSLVISEHNRKTLLLMREIKVCDDCELSERRINSLSDALQNYLNQYMKDMPQGHRWIIIASLFLTFIQELPMHPLESVGIDVREEAGGKTYYCPMKSMEKDSVCAYCVCRYTAT